MRIQLLSDLHLENAPDYRPTPAPNADLLVLAGDIGSYQSGSKLATLGDNDFGLGRFSPKRDWPTPVVMVAGNHEYDNMDIDAAHARLSEVCQRLGIALLEQQSMILEPFNTRLIGTTLWADFDLLAAREKTTTAMYQTRDKAFRAADFYLSKSLTSKNSALFLAQQIRDQSLVCQSWLRAELAKPYAGKTVVITHFAPSAKSQDPRYLIGPGTAGFCNNLDDLLPSADLWLHGHLHCPSDYTVGKCRVVANPRGYARKNEQAKFLDTLCIELN